MKIAKHKYYMQNVIQSFFFLLMLLTVSSSWAQNATWVGTTGDINTASNWSPSGVPSSGFTYTFDNTGTTTTVTGNPAGGVLIVVNSSAGVKDYTISGVLSGATTVTKDGSSTLTLTGANAYTGITNVNAGILNIQNSSALGTTANGTVVANGAILQLQNNITVTGEALTLNGNNSMTATGGTVTTSGYYTIHTFTSSGTFTPSVGGTAEYLVIGGGGGGGGAWTAGNWTGGGGGGAGGYRSSVGGESSGGGASAETPLTLGVGSHPIVVGAGGSGGSLTNNGTNGFDSYIQDPSSVDLVRSLGGGGGAGAQSFVRRDGLAGGSGGGAAGGQGTGSIGGSGTASQGFNGGLHGANRGSGAGGGAGAIGLNSGAAGTDAYGNVYAKIHGGSGGSGVFSSITGTSIQRGGGGGGGCDETGNYLPGIGGLGGGGTGGTPTFTAGSSGTANTGGGGGGGTRSAGGAGGSGLVIIRYLNKGSLENISGNNFWTGTITMLANNIISTTSGTLNVSGVISGSYALGKNGSGTLTLSNANTYTGGTTLSAGTLNINNASALGTSAGTFTIAGGNIDNTSGAAITTVNYPQAWNADFTFVGANDLNLGTGAVTMSASRQVTTSAKMLTVGGVISGSGFGITKNGTGTMVLSGANTYTGVTNIIAGILNIRNNNALGTAANGTVVGTSGKLQLQNNITVTGEALTLNGGGLVLGTGGTMTTFGDYTIHTFTSNGTFNPGINRAVEYLVIGGGGGGGGAWTGGNWTGGGGGGAGGYRSSVGGESSGGGASAESPIMLGVGAHPIVVGAGGSGGSLTNNGTNGFDSYIQDPSSVDVIRSVGGGGGAGAQWFVRRDGLAGGSGGGAAGGQGTGSIGGSGTASQGFNGGLHGANRGSGAGGGAGAIGLNSGAAGTDAYGNVYAKTHGGSGGYGVFSSITGTSIQRGGGGGGGCDETGNYLPGIGGLGGGGTGGTPTFTVGSSGTANTGGGGGGGTRSAGGAGGSGLVVLRYLSIGALENVSGNNFWTGTVTMLADNIITTTSGTLNISGVISGAFALTKNGTGTLILPTANTYSGGTTLKTGTLNINNASALGTAAGTFTIDGGTIDNTSGAAITAVNYPLALNADFTFTGTNDLNLGTGAVTMSANRQVTTSANTLTIGGVINDNTKSLTKLGNGQLSFAAQAVTLNALTISAGTLRSTSGNLSLSGGFTNNGTFTHNSGTAVFAGTSAQSISGSSTTTFNNVTISNSSVTGVTLNSPANVNTLLTLTSGLVNTTATNILTLLNGATTTIGSSVSYINGPMGYVKASIGSSTLNLPLGKSKDWRPEELTVNHGTATSYTYVAELFNGDANAFGYTLPSTINRVSSRHYVDIVRNITGGAASNADLTGATIRMYYSTTNGAGDSVLDYTNLKIAKAPIGGPAWEDIGGTATANGTGNILSNSFTTFSRFALSNNTGGANPLPIVLLSFTAKPNGDDVDLNWTTSVEINNDFFTVERSQDGENFSFVSTVKGAGNSMILKKYYTKDVQPYSGISYYRLKQTDYSGHYQYSNIIAVKFLSEISKSVVVYPNPVANELHIDLPGNTESVNFEILSATGALVYKGSVNERITVPTTSFSSGVYVIKIENGSAFEFKKIIKD